MNRIRNILRITWYPILVSIYPVLYLLLNNISEVRSAGGLRSILISACGALILLALIRLMYGNWHRAAFAVSALLLLFFSYGHVDNLLEKELQSSCNDLLLGITWILLAVLALLFAAWRKIHFEKITPPFNIIALGLVLFVWGQVIWFSIPQEKGDEPADEFAPVRELSIPEGEVPPDIYYIILDSYARADTLLNWADYDNSAFRNHLEELGFYIASCSQSNYNRTDVSLGSSLNLEYLQNLSDDYQPGHTGRRRLWSSINDSAVRLMLEDAGYRTVAFATGFAWSEMKSVDVYLSPYTLWSPMTEFETLLLRTTPINYLGELGLINFDEIDGQRFRQRTTFIFDQMDDLAHMPGPKFVFIHILPPHPPFIFAPDGSWTDPAPFLNADHNYTTNSYREGYRNQVEYITSQIQEAVETLLAESTRPPVIVLQGDHSAWCQSGYRKFTILNAYYLPGHEEFLYPYISPVNTFRMIFDDYLGADYELLPDISYYSPVPNIYEFELMDNPCRQP